MSMTKTSSSSMEFTSKHSAPESMKCLQSTKSTSSRSRENTWKIDLWPSCRYSRSLGYTSRCSQPFLIWCSRLKSKANEEERYWILFTKSARVVILSLRTCSLRSYFAAIKFSTINLMRGSYMDNSWISAKSSLSIKSTTEEPSRLTLRTSTIYLRLRKD